MTSFRFIRPVTTLQANKLFLESTDYSWIFSSPKRGKNRIIGVCVPEEFERKVIEWAYSFKSPLLPLL